MTIPSPEQRQTSFIRSITAMNHESLLPAPPVTTTTSLTDRIGMALSGLCAIHCLVLPLILPFLGTLASFIHSEWTHAVLALLIVPTVVYTSWRGYKHHGKQEVIWLLGIGALAVLAALVVGEQGAGENVEMAVTTFGSALLISGHWQNHKQLAVCSNGKPHSH